MLRLMLNEHPRLHIPNESWFLIDLMDCIPAKTELSKAEVVEALTLITSHRRWNGWNIPDSVIEDRLLGLEAPNLATIIENVFGLSLEKSGKVRWGDKTPEYVIHIRRLYDLFPAAKFVHIIRDARDVSHSLTKKRWRGGFLYRNANYWREHVGQGMDAGRILGPSTYIEVAYENLVRNPQRELIRICDFLGEEFSDNMLDFHKHADEIISQSERIIHAKTTRAPRQSDLNRWKNEMTKFNVAVVESIASGTMKKAGQECFFPSILLIPLALFFIVYRKVSDLSYPVREKFGLLRVSQNR